MKRCLFAIVIFCATARPAAADRVFSSGFETGAAGNNVEWQTGPFLPNITTTNVRTGTYAAWFKPSAKQVEFRVQVPPATAYFARCYFWFDTFPTGETTVFQFAPRNVLNKTVYVAFDDAWSYVGLDRATSIVDVDVENVALAVDAQVQFVAVGIRFTCESRNPCNHVVGVKSEENGTVASATTSIVLPSAYIWWTHSDDAGQRRHPLVQYRDPQNVALRWTNGKIDSMQLRVATTDGNPDTNVTAVWALVEYETQSDLAITLGSR